MSTTTSVPLVDRPPPSLYFVGSAIFHYLGPAFAVLLFVRIDPLGVAWLRILSAALIFAAWRRPWRKWPLACRAERSTIVAWGVVLGLMNASFYIAIDLLPLGTVAAIEFVGPVMLAALGVRSVRNIAAFILALAGVALLAEVRLAGAPVGFAFAFVNMALFTAYIVAAHRASRHEHLGGIDGLAMAMLVAAVVAAPIGAVDALPAFGDPVALAAAVGVGVSSSVVPYVFDQLAMKRLVRSTYALMVALLPATATVIGLIVLTQVPSAIEVVGVSLVIVAVAVHREAASTRDRPPTAMTTGALATTGDRLSGIITANTPPKNAHAASHPAITSSNVSRWHSHTNMCRENTAVKINARTRRRRPAASVR